ncbi:hypothetical protein GWK47_048475 [Chionoecetes opilio]|uniref:Uncharacterized protein n=1 Tax=Chionoecetes opilio TaxID=41210 RepID=A0A8J4YBY1_CHIOP|nr:hypothetical protein GWK47_048475 [Chionoecetes opilio]
MPRTHPHRHQRLRHLQDAVDRLVLRQRTDHILITNLQRAVEEAQGRGVSGERTMQEVREERRDITSLRESVEGVRGSVNQMLKEEQRQDDLLELRQELAHLRSEVKRLKVSRETESASIAAHSHAQQQREAVTTAWLADNVRRLQDAVADVQEAFNVTTAMHDKQEVESRLLVVSKDLGALRGSLAAVTSKAEAAIATATTLQEELSRTSQDSHRTAGKVAALQTEISDMREDFNNLLVALPEGIVASGHPKHINANIQLLRNLEKQRPRLPQRERQLETRVAAVEAGVGEVQASSIQLLTTLEALEARVEKEVTEVRQEVAKLEYRVTAAQDNNKS